MAYTGTVINDLSTTTPTEGTSYIPEMNDAIREVKTCLKTGFDVEHNLTTGLHHFAVANKTANYTATSTDHEIRCDASGGAFTITLPSTSGTNIDTGKRYIVKKVDSSSNAVTIATTSSQTIDGVTTKSLSSQYQTLEVQNNGTNWDVLTDSAWVSVPATSNYETFNCPAVEIANGDYLIFGRFTVPSGKVLNVKAAGIVQTNGTAAPANVLVRVYNATDSSVVYSTGSNRATVTGTSVAAGKAVYFDLNNAGSTTYNLTGFVQVEVANV